MIDWQQVKLEESNKLAAHLLNFVNSYSADNAPFVEDVLHGHRTLQQNVMCLFLQLVIAWAELSDHHYDLRNEATVQASRRIVEALEGSAIYDLGYRKMVTLPHV